MVLLLALAVVLRALFLMGLVFAGSAGFSAAGVGVSIAGAFAICSGSVSVTGGSTPIPLSTFFASGAPMLPVAAAGSGAGVSAASTGAGAGSTGVDASCCSGGADSAGADARGCSEGAGFCCGLGRCARLIGGGIITSSDCRLRWRDDRKRRCFRSLRGGSRRRGSGRSARISRGAGIGWRIGRSSLSRRRGSTGISGRSDRSGSRVSAAVSFREHGCIEIRQHRLRNRLLGGRAQRGLMIAAGHGPIEMLRRLAVGEYVPVGAVGKGHPARGFERTDLGFVRQPYRCDETKPGHDQHRRRQHCTEHESHVRQHFHHHFVCAAYSHKHGQSAEYRRKICGRDLNLLI